MRFVNLLNFLLKSANVGPSLSFNRVIVIWVVPSCAASFAPVDRLGGDGAAGARGNDSDMCFFLFLPSAYRFGARMHKCPARSTCSRSPMRFSRDGAVTATRFPFIGPNQYFTSCSKGAKSLSTIVNERCWVGGYHSVLPAYQA
jgi:hypothetical protein